MWMRNIDTCSLPRQPNRRVLQMMPGMINRQFPLSTHLAQTIALCLTLQTYNRHNSEWQVSSSALYACLWFTCILSFLDFNIVVLQCWWWRQMKLDQCESCTVCIFKLEALVWCGSLSHPCKFFFFHVVCVFTLIGSLRLWSFKFECCSV